VTSLLPTPPTDSLWKFLTISGLVIVIACGGWILREHSALRQGFRTQKSSFRAYTQSVRELGANSDTREKKLSALDVLEAKRQEGDEQVEDAYADFVRHTLIALVIGGLGAFAIGCGFERWLRAQRSLDAKATRDGEDKSPIVLP
jgi:hypothetical protein